MTSQTYQTGDTQLAQEHDEMDPENDLTEPEDALAPTSADLAGPEADGREDEPGTADSSAETPSLALVATAVPQSVTELRLADNTASTDGPWNEIQAMFVDDPHASIERAAGLVNDRVETLIQSVMERQRSMTAACRADDAGTEELRVALQRYRAFWNSLDDFPVRSAGLPERSHSWASASE
jgi:hypothetical protein